MKIYVRTNGGPLCWHYWRSGASIMERHVAFSLLASLKASWDPGEINVGDDPINELKAIENPKQQYLPAAAAIGYDNTWDFFVLSGIDNGNGGLLIR